MAQHFDEFTKGFGNAIDDIRAKFEESVYGRAVTERGGEAPAWPQGPEQEPAFGSVTRNIEVGQDHVAWPQADPAHTKAIEREREDRNRDNDLDR